MTEDNTLKKTDIRESVLSIIFLFLIMLGAAEVVCYLKNDIWTPELPVLTVTFLLTAVLAASFLIGTKGEGTQKELPAFFVPLLLLLSVVLLFVTDGDINVPFYMLGGILLARHKNLHLGLLAVFEMIFLSGALNGYLLEGVLLQLLLGTLLVFLFPRVKSGLAVLYLMITLAAAGIAFHLAFHRFQMPVQGEINLFRMFVSYAILLVAGSIFSFLYGQAWEKKTIKPAEALAVTEEPPQRLVTVEPEAEKEAEPENAELQETFLFYEAALQEEKEQRVRLLKELTEESGTLLTRIREENGALFLHLKKTAELAFAAAERIHADVWLAMAGAYYHDIGKLASVKKAYGADYIEAGIAAAKEWELPEEVVALIREHNIKKALPQSPEAAVVMLSDTILTTMDYLRENAAGKIRADKVVSHSMHLRLAKGALDVSGLSMQQYSTLYGFYMEYFGQEKTKE